MDLYVEKSALKPFLFLRGIEGSTSTFQSVVYPGWFIATSSTVGYPIILTKEKGKTYNTNFYFSPEELIWPRQWVLVPGRGPSNQRNFCLKTVGHLETT